MAEIKKIWLVRDMSDAADLVEFFSSEEYASDEDRLTYFCGSLSEDGPYDFKGLATYIIGATLLRPNTVFVENTRIYDDEATAREDAMGRLAAARKKYEALKSGG